jgi:transposase
VRDYIKRYNGGGLESLKRRNSNGRPTKVKLSKAEWEELLHLFPRSRRPDIAVLASLRN